MYTLTRRRNGRSHPFDLFDELFQTVPAHQWVPALDLKETPDAYVVTLDVPGVAAGDIDISLEKDRLEIRGERKVEETKDGDGWHRVERHRGGFVRALELPGAVDRERIEAEAKHGVLTVILPKRAELKARRIEVRG